ncbi:MAG: hypothetical protein ACAI44_37890 [Candidatus Sericytochromatia bacterium]
MCVIVSPDPAPPAPLPQNLEELQQMYPTHAAALQALVTKAVSSTEHHLADAPGAKKKELAQQQAIDLLEKTYDGAAMVFPGLGGPVAFLAKECLIPLIPGLIDWVVSLFNQTGVFAQGQKGVG